MQGRCESAGKTVGVRLKPGIFESLSKEAKREGISPTSKARQILAGHLAYEGNVEARRSPRVPRRKRITSDAVLLSQQLVRLVTLGRDLSRIARHLEADGIAQNPELAARLGEILQGISKDLSSIKTGVLEALR